MYVVLSSKVWYKVLPLVLGTFFMFKATILPPLMFTYVGIGKVWLLSLCA